MNTSYLPIDSQNASLIIQIAKLGRGQVKAMRWVNAETLSVCTTIGMWEYGIDGSERHITDFEWNGLYSGHFIEYSPDGSLIVANASVNDDSDKRYVYVWDVQSKEIRFAFSNSIYPERGFYSVAFSPNSRFLGAVDYFSTGIWDLDSGKEIAAFSAENGIPRIGFSPDSEQFVKVGGAFIGVGIPTSNQNTVRMSNTVYVVDINSGGLRVPEDPGEVSKLEAWLPPEKPMFPSELEPPLINAYRSFAAKLNNLDNTVRLINLDTSEERIIQHGHSFSVNELIAHTDGKYLTSAAPDFYARLWDIETAAQLRAVRVSGGDNPFFSFSGDGKLLASYDGNKYEFNGMWIVDLISGKEVFRKPFVPVCLNSAGTHLAIKGYVEDRLTYYVVDIATGEYRLLYQFDALTYGELSPDWRFVTCRMSSKEHRLQIRDTSTNRIVIDLEHEQVRYHEAKFTDDSTKILIGYDQGWEGVYVSTLFDLHSGAELIRHVRNSHEQGTVVSPNGSILLLTGEETVKILEIASSQVITTLNIYQPYPIIFTNDSSLLVVGTGIGGLMQIWDIDRGQCLATLKGHIGHVTSLTFNQEESLLFSGGEDGTIRIWGIPSNN